MDFFIVSLVFTAVLVLISFLIARGGQSKLPPGPKPLPIIGNLLDMGTKPHRSLTKLSETYGPIMSLRLGQTTAIVVSSAEMAKEILKEHDKDFSDRSVADALKALGHHLQGMVWLDISGRWRDLRKMCNTHIFTTQKLDANQGLRRQKIQDMLAQAEECCRAGKPIDIGQAAFTTTLNLLSNTFFSMDLVGTNSEAANELKEIMWLTMEEIGKPNLSDFYPVLKKIDPQGIRRRVGVLFKKVFKVFEKIIVERMQWRKDHGGMTHNDMLDTLLNIAEDGSGQLDILGIKHLLLELFVAGNETTSATLEFAMAELLKNPKCLMKAQAELENTIGKGNFVEESDIARLPYLQAVVRETFRMHPPIPFIPRKNSSDVEINGFVIPKNARILVNTCAIGRDPSVWESRNEFIPERFLGSDVDFKGRNLELIPFGCGRRICPGLTLASRMLYQMLASLLHSFNWKLEDGVTPETLDMDDEFGLTVQKAQRLKAIPLPLSN